MTEQTLLILNLLNLGFIFTWGIAFGITNWAKSFVAIFSGKTLNQSTFGKIFDALWIFLLVFSLLNGSLIKTIHYVIG